MDMDRSESVRWLVGWLLRSFNRLADELFCFYNMQIFNLPNRVKIPNVVLRTLGLIPVEVNRGKLRDKQVESYLQKTYSHASHPRHA